MYDYIIIGQGIAGTILSHTLYQNNKKILVLDNEEKSSSHVAAGIYNSITGKRKVKTWEADLLFPFLETYYLSLEKQLDAHFFHPIPMYMLFESMEEQNTWVGKINKENIGNEWDLNLDTSLYTKWIYDLFGGLIKKQSGYIDVNEMLCNWKLFLLEKKLFKSAYFQKEKLVIFQTHIEYDGIKSKRIIFCDGLNAKKNSFFNWLPFNPAKGELIKINISNPFQTIFSRGIFIIPLSTTEAMVGSTYTWDDLTDDCTEKGKEELERKLKKLYHPEYQIINQVAGIRPATRDRRPFIGFHPTYPLVGIFNGFGSKAVSLAPYLAYHFYEYMELGKDLNPEVDISRYFYLYSNIER